MILQFRQVWNADAAGSQGDGAAGFGNRAAGKVAYWALSRVAGVLRGGARAPLRIGRGAGAAPTPHERALETIVRHLAAGDEAGAHAHAIWLVRREAANRLLRALEPVATGPCRLAA